MTKDLERWRTLWKRVEPLPGGVFALRRRLREQTRRRSPLLAFAALALVALVAIVVGIPRSPDRAAAVQLFAADAVPHPEAVALGLAAAARPEQATDARVAGDVLFVWVSPTSDAERRYVVPTDPAH